METSTVTDQSDALRQACRFGDEAEARSLLSASDAASLAAAVSAADDLSGNTPLHLCCANGHVSLVALLLASHAPVNAKNSSGSTPLHYAALNGQRAVVDVLLDAGADPVSENNFGKTPLDDALQGRHRDVVERLKAFVESQASS